MHIYLYFCKYIFVKYHPMMCNVILYVAWYNNDQHTSFQNVGPWEK